MSHYQPRLDDVQFVLHNVLHAPERIAALAPYSEVDTDLINQILEEGGKFIGEQIAPLNPVGDHVGAQWKDCLLYTSPSPRDTERYRVPSSA